VRYPDDFNVPPFPAGKHTAVSRVVAVAVSVVLLIVIFMCVMLLWAQRSVRVHPFLVSVDEITGAWTVVGHHHTEIQEVSTVRTIQESVVGKFMRGWYLISDNQNLNNALWHECNRETDCNNIDKSGVDTYECALYCVASEELFTRFMTDIVPDYQTRFANGELWVPDMASLQISPIGEINANGNVWQIHATIYSNQAQEINILAYAKVGRDNNLYQTTMGYYVQDFNAYRINE